MLFASKILIKACKSGCFAGLSWSLGISFLFWNFSGPDIRLHDIFLFLAPYGLGLFTTAGLMLELFDTPNDAQHIDVIPEISEAKLTLQQQGDISA